jgi:autotransporter-associated beta strand protein
MNGGTILTTNGETVYNGPITLNGDGTISNNNVKMTINGAITGGSALRKIGTGTNSQLVLANTQTYTGDTSVVAGTLLVNGTLVNSSVNTNDATLAVGIGGSGTISQFLSTGTPSVTFVPGGPLAVGTLTVGKDITIGGGGTIIFDLGNTTTTGGGVNDFVSSGGNIGVFGNVSVLINPIQGALAVGRYHLMQGTGINVGSNLTSVSFLSGDPVTNTRLTLTIDTSTTLNGVDLVVGGTGPANLNWNGPGTTAVWDLKNTANFTGGPADNQFFNLDNVTFTGGASTVTVTGTGTLALRPGSVTVNSAQSYTFAGTGVLTGGMTLTKSGSGQLTVSNPNTYTGGTQINGGTMQLGVANALGTAPITIANTAGAVLNLSTFGQSVNGLSGGGSNGGEVKVGGGNFTVTVAYPNSNSYAGMLSGTGTLTKAGLGSLTLSGSLPYTGAVAVTGGKLVLASSLPSSTTMNISDQAMVQLGSGGKLLGCTTLNLNTTGVIDLNDGAMAIDYTATSALATVTNQIKAGLTDKSSIGPGNILSSAVSGGLHPTALGYADASVLGITSFAGKTIDTTTTLVRYTLVGDSNLDLHVNALDFNAVASNFGGSSKTWALGDFNMDGLVNTGDFNALAQNFNAPAPVAGPAQGLGTLVPEPIALSIVPMTLLMARRRRR